MRDEKHDAISELLCCMEEGDRVALKCWPKWHKRIERKLYLGLMHMIGQMFDE